MAEPIDNPTVEDLAGCRIVTAEGKTLGHVVDVVVQRDTFAVVGLLFGVWSWLYRLDIFLHFVRSHSATIQPHVVPWGAVASCDRFTVTLKPGGERDVRDFDL